jgi:DNA-binding NarL/FixJ family response regulator
MVVSPGSRIIIVTTFGEDDKVVPAVQEGAHGYLFKDVAPAKPIQAIPCFILFVKCSFMAKHS